MKTLLTIVALAILARCSLPPPPTHTLPDFFESPGDSDIRIAFYNVENLFDTFNDPEKDDDDFTPMGSHRWTYSRYRAKVGEHAQTIRAVGGWSGVDIIGLAEIENSIVLGDLINAPSLKELNYRFVHFESPDPRGIDVGLLWRNQKIHLDTAAPIALPVDSGDRPLRDMLWCRFVWNEVGFHLIIAHWPSRYGGQMASEEKRKYAAKRTNEFHDRISIEYPGEWIAFMGDLNDEPHNEALSAVLGWSNSAGRWDPHPPPPNEWPGSHVHKGKWSLIDQCYISKNPSRQVPSVKADTLHLFPARWLLEETDGGDWIPFRTYLGPSYHGGVSDHLPFYFDISLE
ncbi:MAG: hypothetical protein J4F31_05885 [Flavobacteriales bacterium]|nr:hypothetical protein [Flavobacteriales bacterium]